MKKKISIFKYVLANPEFSLKDKLYFLGFYPFTIGFVVFLIWVGYKGIKKGLRASGLDLLILLLLFFPLLKYQKSVARKFFIPSKKLIGKPQKAKKLERGISYTEEFYKITRKVAFKFYLIEALTGLAIVLLLIGIFVIPRDISQYKRLLPLFTVGTIASFAVFLYCYFRTLKGYTGKTIELAKKYGMYKKWQSSFNKALLWSIIIIPFAIFLVVIFFLLV